MFRIPAPLAAAPLAIAGLACGSAAPAPASTLLVPQATMGGGGAGIGEEACGLPEIVARADRPRFEADPASRGMVTPGEADAAAEPKPDFSRIDELTCTAGTLPEGQSAITAKVQTLFDRADVSPGVIDGWRGTMTESAIRAFEQREGLPVDGLMDGQVWAALGAVRGRPVTQSYTVTPDDVQVVGPIPSDYSEQAGYARLGYQRVTEKLAETFHMDEEFLRALNPRAAFAAGETVTVMAPGRPIVPLDRESEAIEPPEEPLVPAVVIDKSAGRLYALDRFGRSLASYPVTIGSPSTPSPSGTHEVLAVVHDPVYYYDPANFVQGDNLTELELPPGPNNPVGPVWIDLSREGYGIHGTPEPSKLFALASHGCVRMTNWDALELAAMVGKGTRIEFAE